VTLPYDSGLVVSQREAAQDAIIARLVGALGGTTGFLEAVIPLSFRVHDDESWDLAHKELRGRFPAIMVGILDRDASSAGGPGRSLGELEVQIIHCSKHMRGTVEGRATTDHVGATSPRGDVGLWGQMELTDALLFDWKIGIKTIHQLRMVKESEIITMPEYSAWQQVFKLPVERSVDWARGVVVKLERIVSTLKETTVPAAHDLTFDSDVPPAP